MKKALFAALIAITALSSAQGTVYTQTWTGTATGTDGAGVFGGGQITDQPFVVTYVFDDELGGFQANGPNYHQAEGGSGYFDTESPNISTTVLINGYSWKMIRTFDSSIYSRETPTFSEASSYAQSNSAQVNNVAYEYGDAPYGNPETPGTIDVSKASLNAGYVYINSGETYIAFNNLSYSSSRKYVSALPEPPSWAAMISGFGMIGIAIRRKKTALRFA